MGTILWLCLVAAGIAIGVAIGRFWPLDALRTKTLEAERDAARQDLVGYREQVSDHFKRTGELFDRITADYRSLYEHLASGASELCDAPPRDVLQAEPERRSLKHDPAAAAAVSTAALAAGATATAALADEPAAPDEQTGAPMEAQAASEEAGGDAGTEQPVEGDAPLAAAPAEAQPETPAPAAAPSGEADGELPRIDGEERPQAVAGDEAEKAAENETVPPAKVNGHLREDEATLARRVAAG